ncbi:cyclin-K [Odontomachus brunneus]|uniref:cyclin-K n=1 Tax=Odontomachus brunneus TaxID=486640 RepID=UPI0013F2897F|nr:cyclin-K [Odontomachus brunneus]XP_032683298.1 cyclin-K [Odontomachus brunneus]XP_032683299.1 cyclin-K [Odontomachus brunneus]
MPCWYYEKKELRNTPSIQDGIDYETECRYRKEGARFIIDTGTKMDLGYNTMATGVVYFHRFYMFHSFKNFPRYVTACCCLLLAGKVEETPKKCKDIIRTAKTLVSEQKFMTFGEDPKEEVLTLEKILLQTIKFDLQVEHPYSYLLKYAKCLKGDKNKLQKMVQMAWTFVNDSLCTTLSLQWEPEIIAVALMYLAGKLSKFEVLDWAGRQPKHLRWWDMFVEDVTMDLLEDICHQVLDLYSQANNTKPPDSPPIIPSSEVCRERPSAVTNVESASNTPNVTPGKSSKIETPVVSANGCPPADITDTIKPMDVPATHFPTYPANFAASNNTNYPAAFPPANVSVPPPPVNTMNHIVPTMHHIGSSAAIRPTPSSVPTTNQPPFQPYSYPTNTPYFSANNPIPPSAAPPRNYYPPQP